MKLLSKIKQWWDKFKPFPPTCPHCKSKMILFSYDQGYWRFDCETCPKYGDANILAGYIVFINQKDGAIIRQIKCFPKYTIISTFTAFPDFDAPNRQIGTYIAFHRDTRHPIEWSSPIQLNNPMTLPSIQEKVTTFIIFS